MDKTPRSSAADWIPFTALVPWAENPRINEAAVEAVAASIESSAWGAPIVAQVKTSRVIAGHTRLLAARHLTDYVWQPGDSEVVGHWRDRTDADGPWQLEGAPEPGMVPVRFLDVTDRQADRLTVADNRTSELSGWDDDKLADLLTSFSEEDGDNWLHGIGFEQNEVDALLGNWSMPDEFDDGESAPADAIVDDGKAKILVTVAIADGGDVSDIIIAALDAAEVAYEITLK